MKKINKKLENEFSSDTYLLCPDMERKHKDRKRYLYKYIKNSCSEEWENINAKKAGLIKNIKDIIYNNKNGKKHTILTLCTGMIIGAGMASGIVSYNCAQTSDKQVKTKATKDDAIAIVLCGILGLLIAAVYRDSIKECEAETSFYVFYRRLAARYFKVLRNQEPKVFSDRFFKRMNPEMADVVIKFLIANLADNDINTLQKLAVKLHTKYNGGEERDLEEIQKGMATGLNIIENFMNQNPDAYRVIKSIFWGDIPNTLIINNTNQQTR